MRINFKILLAILALILLAAWTAESKPIIADTSLVDSVIVDSVVAFTLNGGAVVPVWFTNSVSLGGMELTVTMASPDFLIDSISFVGGRVDTLTLKGFTGNGVTLSVFWASFSSVIPVGTGLLGNLFISYSPAIADQVATIDTVSIILGDTEYTTFFSDSSATAFIPQYIAGKLDIRSGTCCLNIRGNMNGDILDEIDISDLTYLVNYMFGGGPEPPCLIEANINGSPDDLIDISDLSYLVAFMFGAGPAPAACP